MSTKPPPGVNETTGEIEHDDEEVHVRPFAELLTLFDRGAIHDESSRGLHDLIAAVQSMGKKGGMNIAIEVHPMKGTRDQLMLSAKVTVKLPSGDPTAAVFFVDNNGNLTRNDPRQMEIDGLRVIEPKPAKIVEV